MINISFHFRAIRFVSLAGTTEIRFGSLTDRFLSWSRPVRATRFVLSLVKRSHFSFFLFLYFFFFFFLFYFFTCYDVRCFMEKVRSFANRTATIVYPSNYNRSDLYGCTRDSNAHNMKKISKINKVFFIIIIHSLYPFLFRFQ